MSGRGMTVPEAEIRVMAEIFAVLLRGGDARVMMRAPLARSFAARLLRAKQRAFIDSIPTAATLKDDANALYGKFGP